MRSELVMGALTHIPNRYQLAHTAAKAIRAFHRPNTRIADTVNEVLTRFSFSDPIARAPQPSSRQPAELRVVREPELRRAS
ncbi:MAG: DNA-directed RNA polymerase subunit omega [Acidobacteriaceae bacterium]